MHFKKQLFHIAAMNRYQFNQYSNTIRNLSSSELQGSAPLNEQMRIASDGDVEVWYAPFEYINPAARVVIVGITPGRTQMMNALRECRAQIDRGASDEMALMAAKQTAAFSGAMRPNLIAMLDRVGIQKMLGLGTCAALFGERSELVQTTSVLRNPVFVNGGNYNGNPDMVRHPLLQQQLIAGFGQDAATLPDAVYIPLGDKVSQALFYLADKGHIEKERIMEGLPHPSGANAERIAYFLGNKARASLSKKTSPEKLDQAREELCRRIAALA